MVIGVAIVFAGSERNCFQKHLWGIPTIVVIIIRRIVIDFTISLH